MASSHHAFFSHQILGAVIDFDIHNLLVFQIDHDVVRSTSSHPDQLLGLAGVAFDMRHEWRNEDEVSFFHVNDLAVALAVADEAAPLVHVTTGLSLAMMMRGRNFPRTGVDLAKPDLVGRTVFLADAGNSARVQSLAWSILKISSLVYPENIDILVNVECLLSHVTLSFGIVHETTAADANLAYNQYLRRNTLSQDVRLFASVEGIRQGLRILVTTRDSVVKDRTRSINALNASARSNDLEIYARRKFTAVQIKEISRWSRTALETPKNHDINPLQT